MTFPSSGEGKNPLQNLCSTSRITKPKAGDTEIHGGGISGDFFVSFCLFFDEREEEVGRKGGEYPCGTNSRLALLFKTVFTF